MRAARAMVILAAALVPGGCGTSERDVVKAKVEQFVKAVGSKDFKTICDQVLAPSLLERLAADGLACEQAMQIALGTVQNPTLSVGAVTISGTSASVITLSAANGQPASLAAIELVKSSAGWRIRSLGATVAARSRATK